MSKAKWHLWHFQLRCTRSLCRWHSDAIRMSNPVINVPQSAMLFLHSTCWTRFWTLKAFRYLKFCFCAFTQLFFFLPTVRLSLSVLHLRLSGKHSLGMSAPLIPRGSGMNTQGHDMIHAVTQVGYGMFSCCCNPDLTGCSCRQERFLRAPKSMLK